MSSPRRIRRGTLVIRAWRAGLVVCTALLATVVATPTDRRANASGNPTIDGRFQAEGPLLGGRFLQVDVLGRGGVPLSGVGAVALNITAVNASADTHLSVNGLGAEPATSNLNIRAGSPPVSNMVIVDTVASGAVTITNRAGSVDVLVDVLGWFPIGAFRSVARWIPASSLRRPSTSRAPVGDHCPERETSGFSVAAQYHRRV